MGCQDMLAVTVAIGTHPVNFSAPKFEAQTVMEIIL